jgi:RND family efflux transporter MFP subunit
LRFWFERAANTARVRHERAVARFGDRLFSRRHENLFSAIRREMNSLQLHKNRRFAAAWRIFFALLFILAQAGSTPSLAAVTAQAGPYRVEVSTDPAEIPVGKANLVIKITDASGAPIEGATVRTLAKMTGMYMGERQELAMPKSGEKGVYVAPAAFPMAGSYAAEIEIVGSQGTAKTSISLATGQNTGASGGFSILSLWPWVLGVLLLLFVLYRMKKTGQRISFRGALNKQAIGALLLLLVVSAVSIYAIRNWRRPGAMTPIEAQAMDMKMPAPEGVLAVELAKVSRGNVQSTVRYTGQAVGFLEQEVNPRVTGIIEWMPFYAGDRVKKGQVIARLDTSEYVPQIAAGKAEVGQASENVKVARAQREEAAAEVERARAEIGIKSGAVEEAKSNRGKDVAAVDEARGALAQARSEAQKAQAEVAAKRSALAEVQSGETKSGAALREARSGLDAARAAAAEAQSDIEAAREASAGAVAQAGAIETNIEQAQADLQAARADLEYWQKEIARMKVLVEQGAVSREEFQREQAQYENAQAKVRAALSRVASAKASSSASQAAQRRAAAMIQSAQAKARGAEANIKSNQARVAQAESEIAASGARTQQAAANIQAAQAAVKSAQARTERAQAGVRMAQAEVGAAQARIAQAAADKKAQQARAQGARAAEGTAGARVGVAQAGVGQARAGLFAATTRRGYTEIRSLVNGVVTQRLISPGVLVQPGQAILKLAQIRPIRVQANVAESDLAKIQVGSSVTIRNRDNPKITTLSRVTSIAPAVDPASRTGVVEAILPNTNEKFLSGQYAVMEIATGQKQSALRVPSRAIQWRDVPASGVLPTSAQQAFVWIAEPVVGEEKQFTAKQVSVETGDGDGQFTAILSGLKVNQSVILGEQAGLKNGDRVVAPDADTSERRSDAGSTPDLNAGPQTATISVTEKGFTPTEVNLRAGVPARVTFIRKTEATCATEVVLPEFNIEKKLPMNQPIVVEFTPRKTGELVFGCGMDLMLRGKLVVR